MSFSFGAKEGADVTYFGSMMGASKGSEDLMVIDPVLFGLGTRRKTWERW